TTGEPRSVVDCKVNPAALVGHVKITSAPEGMIASCGGAGTFTVTVKAQLEVLPCASVAVLVTVVVPTAKLLPLAGLFDTVTPGQLSVAVTLNVTLLLPAPGAASTTMFAGQVIAGACVSA